jgi:hypothetical protein
MEHGTGDAYHRPSHGVRHLWVGGVVIYDDILITMTVAPLLKHGTPSTFRVTELSDDFPLNKPRR